MNFDKESKSVEFVCFFLYLLLFFRGGGGAGEEEWREGTRFQTGKNMYSLTFCAHALYKIQVPRSSGSLVLAQTKRVMDR